MNQILSGKPRAVQFCTFSLSIYSTANAEATNQSLDEFIAVSAKISAYLGQGNSLGNLLIARDASVSLSKYGTDLDSYYDLALNGLDNEIKSFNRKLVTIDAAINQFSGNDEALNLLRRQRSLARERLAALSINKSTFQTLRAAGSTLEIADVIFSGVQLAEDINNDNVSYNKSVFPVLTALSPFAISATSLSGGTALVSSVFGPVTGIAGGTIIMTDNVLDAQRNLGDEYRSRISDLRTEYFAQFNQLAAVAGREGRERALELEIFYRTRRQEIARELAEIQDKLSSNFVTGDGELPFSGKAELAQYAGNFADFLEFSASSISERQINFIDNYLEKVEVSNEILAETRLTALAIEQPVIEISITEDIQKNLIEEINSNPDTLKVIASSSDTQEDEADRLAEQARLLAEQQRQLEAAQREEEQRQADLSDAVDDRRNLEQSREETEVRLQEARNLVTVLRFNEAENAQNELRSIASEIQSLRDRKQASVGFDALEVRQRQVARDIQRLRAVIQVRQSLTSPSSITARQKRILNRYADDFGIVARNGQEPWQLLMLQAGRILGRRNNELRDISNRINAIEAVGVYTNADERRFQRLVRREEELERRLDSLDNRLRIAEANVDRLEGQLSGINQDIAANDSRIEALRRDGDIIDFNNYNVREFAETDWESFSIFDDYGQINDQLPNQSDIENEITNDRVAGLNPDNGQPGTDGGSDTGGGGNEGSQGGDRDDTYTPTTTADLTEQVGLIAGVTANTNNTAINPSATNPRNAYTTTRRNLDVVTAPAPGAVRDHDSRGATHIVKTSTDSSGYSYLSWGRSRTLLEENRSDIGATTTTEDILWMSGSPTPVSYFTNRTGTADYSGTMFGDFVSPTGEKTVGNVTGNLNLSFNLGTNQTTGSGNLNVSGNQWADFTVNGALAVTSDGNAFEISNASMNDTSGDGQGFIEGFFFGASAEEAGGVFEYFKSTGTVAGVWTTKATPTSSPSTNWDGTATYIYARDDGNGGTHPSSGTVSITDVNTNKTRLTFRQDDSKSIAPGTLDVSSSSFSRFSYLGMGAWGEGASYVVSDDGTRPVQFGHWVAYDATQDRPQTGTATYYGRLNGDYYEPDTDLTRHQAVTGSVELTANFGTSAISGELEMAVNGSHWTTATFSESILSFGDRHGFEGDLNGTGYENTDIRAFFAGPNAEEIGGQFRINSEPSFRNNGTVAGVFGASQTGAPDLSFSSTLVAHTSTQTSGRDVYNIGATIDRVPTQSSSLATISLPASDGGGTVTTTQVLGSGGFNYTSWGRWGSNTTSPSTHAQDGHWIAGNITPTSTVENMTGTATYNGGMIGDFVSGSGARSAATGNIQLTADFSNQSISGNMQFETAGQTSSVAQLNASITNGGFSQTTSTHGFEGNFFGPNAEEVGGSTWMNDNGGTYNGVFRAAQ